MSSKISNKETLFEGFSRSLLNTQSILDVFVLQDILDPRDADTLKLTLKTNREIENFLLKNRLVTRDTINKAYSIILKLPYISLSNVLIPDEALSIIPNKLAKKYGVIAFDLNDGRLVRLAISRPADLLYGFVSGLTKIFQSKDYILELFITGTNDFNEAYSLYKKKDKDKILLRKGSLPVIALKNSDIPEKFLKKVPEEFIKKYRVAVFDKNVVGDFMVACEEPDSAVTKKVLSFIEKENQVRLEVFATSRADMDYILDVYNGKQKKNPSTEKSKVNEKKTETATESKTENKINLVDTFRTVLKKYKGPEIIVDEFHKDYSGEAGVSVTIRRRDLPEVLDLEFIKKLPKKFVEKYHIVIFGENSDGDFQVGTDRPGNPMTEKAIDFIKEQQNLQVFEISQQDFKRALGEYK